MTDNRMAGDSEKLFIKIVKKIRCPDYGDHRETEAYADFRRETIALIEDFRRLAIREVLESEAVKRLTEAVRWVVKRHFNKDFGILVTSEEMKKIEEALVAFDDFAKEKQG